MDGLDLYLHDNIYFYLDLKGDRWPNFHFNLYNFVAYLDEKTKFMQSVRSGVWDGRVSFYSRETQKLPIGLLGQLVEFCSRFQVPIHYKFEYRLLQETLREGELDSFLPRVFKPGFMLRGYQREAVEKSLTLKRGIVCAATSSGKSAQIYAISRFLVEKGRKVLIIVPTVGLVEQLLDNFREYGWNDAGEYVCLLRAGKKLDLDKDIIITTYQSFVKQDKGVYESIGAVLVDEAHLAQGASIQKILKRAKWADYRLGFTGTLPRDLFATVKITSLLGPKIYEIKTETLQGMGNVAKCKVVNLFLKYPIEVTRFLCKKRYYGVFDAFGENYLTDKIPGDCMEFFESMPPSRMKRILERKIAPFYVESGIINYNRKRMNSLKFIYDKVGNGKNVLILVQELYHFNEVHEYLKTIMDPDSIYLISGDVKPEERERIRQKVEKNQGVTILATFGTMSTGISITTLEHIVLFKSFRSEIRTLQTIGRGLRLNPNKDFCVIWDIIDDFSDPEEDYFNFCFKHWIGKGVPGNDFGRLDYYKEQKFPLTKMTFTLD